MEIDKTKLEEIAKKYGLKMVLLFGSQINGRIKNDSDIDIAYSAKTALTLQERIDLNDDLANLFSFEKIDQVNLLSASPLLLKEIAQKSQLIFGKQIDYIKFKAKAFRIFIDNQPLFDLQDGLIKKKHNLLAKKIYA